MARFAPRLRHGDVGRIEGFDGGAAEEAEGAVHAFAEDLEGAGGAGFAGSAETISISAADEHGAGTEAKGFDDVGAAADATVEQDFGLASYGGDDFRKHAERRGNSVELTAAVIRNDDAGGSLVDGAASIVGGENALRDDRAGPEFAEPAKIFPGDDSATERGADVDERHGAFAGNDDVGERRSPAVEEKGSEPTGTREKLRDIGKFREERAAEKFFHAVARVALAESGDRRVDGDDKGVETGLFGAVDGVLGDGATTDQIKLIPGRAFGGGADVFQGMAGDGGEGVDGASVAGCGCGGTFATVAAGIHHAGITDRSENRGKRKVERKDASANIGFGNGDGPARAEEDVIKDAAIFAESDFAVGAAIEVIENNAREAALRHFAKIVDVDDAGW